MSKHKGSCLCGEITFVIKGDLPPLNACHCTACRKQSGHFEASVDVPRTALSVTGEAHVGWYQSSEKVRRGFCKTCGSTLFWDPVFQDWTAVAMGAFDTPTHTKRLPTVVGRISDMLFEVLKYDVFCDGTVGG